ncbi:metal ABC transporter ATP-binding protein [Pseudodesulfovibrio sediminis]|uniref:Zinc ABC transporter ATP-binding protein n=1 Tax=Pseudodesulfovibrio sediminis TaxID=2810563 RepID=A0ABN6EZ87_9BACT|nr:ABC transporter ATP-binding protein [Pseudodesulfovibrio sediminis]BCS90103.1 zinc ABC transporter ATP-binding protein [Pseudodesulfovibrio sediminis]
MSEFIVEIEEVNYSVGQVPILENVNLHVEAGDYMAVLGPNGGGKSTLLKLILGLIHPDSGTVKVLGAPAGQAGGRIGYLPQHTHVAKSFPITVVEAVCMGLIKPGFGGISGLSPSAEERDRALAALEQVNMADFARRSLSGLSGGQRQRVFIARALVDDPKLLMLDEPTASVDSASRNALFELLVELNTKMTVIMVSHDISSLASGVKSVVCVNRGLHHHHAPEVTDDMYHLSYGTPGQKGCPVELVTHGHVPHRVLGPHDPQCTCELGCAHTHDEKSS